MQFILWLTFQVLTLNTIHSHNNNGCKLNLPPAPPPKFLEILQEQIIWNVNLSPLSLEKTNFKTFLNRLI